MRWQQAGFEGQSGSDITEGLMDATAYEFTYAPKTGVDHYVATLV